VSETAHTPVRTEEDIHAYTIGAPDVLASTVALSEYDPGWPALFEREAARVRAVLGDQVRMLEHVGSTSVPNLAAKPRIDMLLVVPDSRNEEAYVPPMEAAGYVLRIREPEWFEHRLFKGPDTDINLHVFSAGCREIDRMLGFRDWLITHDEDRLLYEQTKRELATRTWTYMQNYADAKNAVVDEIADRAGLPPRLEVG
jgi:GrpB-like predicted nucleotidyltransferase (UPF0157 family)